MQIFTLTSRIIVTCSNRLAPYLQKEIEALGFTSIRIFKTGVELQGSLQDCIKLNLHLRCASQVLFSLKECRATDAEDVYKVALDMPWEEIIPATGYFSVTSNVNNDTITNNLYVNVKVKDAIADRCREKTGSRPNSGSELNGVVIHLYWKDELAELFIDTSGDTLSKHGYRRIPGKAPMLESLAAATIYATDWDRKTSFVNPMCGSGTLAIEAALIATNRVPGLYRYNYAFMHLVGYTNEMYSAELAIIQAQVIDNNPLKIYVSDISEDAINVAKINAGVAGVEEMMVFEVCSFEKATLPNETGSIVFFNPEYGDRLGEEKELEITYALIGDFMKKQCKGYMGYIFTGNLVLAKKIGLKPKRRLEFYTSKIDCRLLEYELYSGSREIKKEL